MAYHGGVASMPGGYLGVDVFFVLSGYLITSLLVAEWAQSRRISLRGFWARRARRLLPALFVMLAGVAVYAWLLAEPRELARIRGDALATLGYVANWRYVWSGASYFEQFGVPSPLRHTWSLAIEEQWYLLWPLLVVVMLRLGRGRTRLLGSVCASGAVVSAGLMAWRFDPTGDWSRVYYGTDTRVQGLLVGALLAIVLAARPGILVALSGRAIEAAGVCGALLLAWFAWQAADTDAWMYRGGFLLVAVASAAVIASAVRPPGRERARSWSVRSALSVRPLRAVGRVSYGLYLWHWPVDVALTSQRVGFAGPGLFALRTAVAGAAAAASYVLVEHPIRARRMLRPGRAARAAVPVAAAATVLALVAATAGARPMVVEESLVVGRTGSETSQSGSGSPSTTNSEGPGSRSTADGDVAPSGSGDRRSSTPADGSVPSILLAGDSSTFTLADEFEPDRYSRAEWHFLAALGCGVVRGDTVSGGRTWRQRAVCRAWPEQWAAWSRTWDIDLAVIQIGAWEVLDLRVGDETLRVGTDAHARYLAGELEEAIEILDAPVVFLRVPCYGPSPDGARLGTERTDIARVDAVNDVIESVVKRHADEARMLDSAEWLCPGGRYVDERDGVQVRHDGVHFEGDGAAAFWAWLAPRVEGLASSSLVPEERR